MKEQADTEIMLNRRDIAMLNKRKIEERIFAIVQEYDRYAQTNDLLTYLKNIGYYVKF